MCVGEVYKKEVKFLCIVGVNMVFFWIILGRTIYDEKRQG